MNLHNFKENLSQTASNNYERILKLESTEVTLKVSMKEPNPLSIKNASIFKFFLYINIIIPQLQKFTRIL